MITTGRRKRRRPKRDSINFHNFFSILVNFLLLLLSSSFSCYGDITYNKYSNHPDEDSFPPVSTLSTTIPRACSQPPHDNYTFCNTDLPLSQRVDDLISRLTLDEKPWLLTARVSPYGNITRLGVPEYNWGANCVHGVQSRCFVEKKEIREELSNDDENNNNITSHNNTNIRQVVRCPTSFPNPNTLGSTFHKTLWKQIGTVMGIELRAFWLQNVTEYSIHNPTTQYAHLGLDCWSPNINIVRDPRWGRNMESPGEDPYVAGMFGTMITLGLQNNTNVDPTYLQAVSTIKHFTANSIEGQWWNTSGAWVPRKGHISRHNVNTIVSLYDMTTTYLPAFKMAVQDGNAAGIMCSFNRINGIPSCVNEDLLQKTLRKDWNFRGYVTSDTQGLNDVRDNHHYVDDWETTVGLAIKAGCDVESGGTGASATTDSLYIQYLPDAVRAGIIPETLVDEALRNALSIRFRLGLFDPIDNQPLWKIPPNVIQSTDHIQLSREATAAGMVLLKNEPPTDDGKTGHGLIPLSLQSTIALIGPHIDDRTTLVGNYIGEICYNDTTNQCVTSFEEGFRQVATNETNILSSKGCAVSGNDTSKFDDAMKIASKSDVVVFIGGLDLHLEEEDWDRPDIRLPQIQTKLIHELSKVNSNIVLILLHGGMVGIDNVINKVSSIVSVGYPGPYGGMVIPQVLYGLESSKAWGKTTITWYRDNITDQLNMLDFNMARPPGRTYRYYTGAKPHFPFGFGLHPFIKTALTLEMVPSVGGYSHSDWSPSFVHKRIEISISVVNHGSGDGDEVILAYFEPLNIPSPEPASNLLRQLFAFDRIHVPVGVPTCISFNVTSETLQLADAAGDPMTFPGSYNLVFSNGNKDEVAIVVNVDERERLSVVTDSRETS